MLLYVSSDSLTFRLLRCFSFFFFFLLIHLTRPTSVHAVTHCDNGTAEAPCQPANKRLVIVAKDGSGQHSDLLPALNDARPGDTIQLKNGIYSCGDPCDGRGGYLLTKSGSRDLPITIMNYPGHKPQLRMTITILGQWVILQGLEITLINGDGIHLYYNLDYGQKARHITIRGNWIHENGFIGMYGGAISNLLVDQNTFERNGVGPGDCTKEWGGLHNTIYKYAHCHGIYLNNNPGNGPVQPPMTGITIRRNKFIANAGFGWTNRTDGARSTNFLVENNLFLNNSINQGFIDLDQSTIRNNTLVIFTYARVNEAQKTCFYSNHNTQNVIANNVCYSTLDYANGDALFPIHSWGSDSTVGNTWSHNAFFVKATTAWRWGGNVIQNFLNTYTSTTKDPSPLLLPIATGDGAEAGFVDATAGNFHLTASSPLRRAGNPAQCPAVDIEGTLRRRESCDIGAYTFR